MRATTATGRDVLYVLRASSAHRATQKRRAHDLILWWFDMHEMINDGEHSSVSRVECIGRVEAMRTLQTTRRRRR